MMRFTYPRSFLSLLLIGFSIVAAPLVFALFTNVMAFERLAAISEQAVHTAVRITQASRSKATALVKSAMSNGPATIVKPISRSDRNERG